MQVLMSSRRTIQSGEVVTFATEFEPWDSVFGTAYRAKGPFDVSASRDAVVVHRAVINRKEDAEAFAVAMKFAEGAHHALAPTWRGGAPSMYPSEPTVANYTGSGAVIKEG